MFFGGGVIRPKDDRDKLKYPRFTHRPNLWATDDINQYQLFKQTQSNIAHRGKQRFTWDKGLAFNDTLLPVRQGGCPDGRLSNKIIFHDLKMC